MPLRAALIYTALVFAVGFALGVLRTLVLVPRLGPTFAVLLELPVMLTAAWFLCRTTLRRRPVAPGVPRLLMGGAYLVLLLLAEAALGIATGSTWETLVAGSASPAGALGLAAQAATALYPRLQRP